MWDVGWWERCWKWWISYRYRFVPWIVVNLRKRNVKKVLSQSTEIHNSAVLSVLEKYFSELYQNHSNVAKGHTSYEKLTHKVLGFSLSRSPSKVAGTGVFVGSGTIEKGALVAIYPGTVYDPHEPIFFQSLLNPFIFRCVDGVLIDGKDTGLSRMIYRSCGHRDQVGAYFTSDISWLGPSPCNNLAVGQYVNNGTQELKANVVYHELDIPHGFPLRYLKYIPNASYSFRVYGSETNHIRTVVLVALRDIHHGEELFSSYFTVVF